MQLASQGAGGPLVASLRSSGITGGPARLHACGPAREGSGRDAAWATMGAEGMQLGSVDEGSPPEGRPGSPRRLQSGRAGSPVARPPARWPLVGGRQGCGLAAMGGGRDSTWQRG